MRLEPRPRPEVVVDVDAVDRAALLEETIDRLRAAPSRRLLLDYDGTCVPLTSQPELAVPDDELCELLRTLALEIDTEVVVVSGRSRPVLATWLGHLPIGLCAEHGLWLRTAPVVGRIAANWRMLAHPHADLGAVAKAMEVAAARHAGCRIEHKDHGIAFHYRNAVIEDEELAGLKVQFAEAGGRETWLIDGNRVLEVVPRGVSKALAIKALHRDDEDVLVFAAGDDTTDLSLLAALPDPSLAATVGTRLPRHALWFPTPLDLRGFLRALL